MNYLRSRKTQIVNCLYAVLVILIVLAPLQGLITTWPASIFGYQLFWQTWKELLLIPSLLFAGLIVFDNRQLRKKFSHDKIFIVIGAYSIFSTLLALFVSKDHDAAIAGLLLNLRLFAVYFLAWTIARSKKMDSGKLVRRYVLPVAVVVAGFAVLQVAVLAPEFLKHFGYEANPIPARFTIDNNIHAIRAASTTRGPNSLGAYLVLPAVILLSYLYGAIKDRVRTNQRPDKRWPYYVASMAVILGGIYATHSRSALIAFAVASCSWLALRFTKRNRLYAGTILVGLVVVVGTLTYVYRDVAFIRNTVFHDNSGNLSSATSNVGHLTSLETGAREVVAHPVLGCGPGCAGPASYRSSSGPKIAENYYIQIAEETGLLGAILFITIVVLVGRRLYHRQSDDEIARVLLAVLIGISVCNLLLHTWADDTIAYLWWGLAGLVIGSYSRLDSETASAKRLRTSALKND